MTRLLTHTAAQVQAGEPGGAAHGGGARSERLAKRRAAPPELNADHTDEDNDAFQNMDMDMDVNQPATLGDQEGEGAPSDNERSTPQPLEDDETATASESEPNESTNTQTKTKEPPEREQSSRGNSGRPVVEKPPPSPPPRRELPFVRRGQQQGRVNQTRKSSESTAGEAEDDEL